MSPSKISALAALFAGLSVSAALAQPPTGYYLGGGLGATIAEDSDIDGAGIDTEADMDTGFAGVAAFGYRYGSNYRGEIELGYRTNGIDGLSGATTAVQGDVNTWTLMANVLYDYSPAGKFHPYFGVGAGIARIDIDGATPVDGTTINDHDAVPALRGILGISYDLAENVEIFGDYRYLHAFDPEFNAAGGARVDADYDNHAFMVGLRYGFGAAPAPAPAPTQMAEPAVEKKMEPARKTPRSFLIFFDWNNAAITPEARAILSEAAAHAKSGARVRIALTGHADRSGAKRYNIGLSKRRAEAAKTTLMAMGVLGRDLSVAWKGEAAPLVPTNDGVREPRNRRVRLVVE